MGDTQRQILAFPLQRLDFLSLGPNGTYYARGLKDTEHPWAGTWKGEKGRKYSPASYHLPQSLMSDPRMAERLTKERTQVWLGRNGSWVVHWDKGNSSDPNMDVKWHLNDVGLYPGLENFLRTYKTASEEFKYDPEKPMSRWSYMGSFLLVSFYPLTRSIPASGNALSGPSENPGYPARKQLLMALSFDPLTEPRS